MIKLENSIQANCSPEDIWREFNDITTWPVNVPSIIGAAKWESGEPWVPGSKFSMKLLKPMPVYFTPEILEATPPNGVHWIARGTAVTAEQWFNFEAQPDGTTKMTARQQFDGPMTFMFGETVQKQISDMYNEWMTIVKNLAEQRKA
jgi:hypothetical protein